jgi:GTP cyclohydrolase II
MKSNVQKFKVVDQPVLLNYATVRRQIKIPLTNGDGTFFTFRGLKDSREHVAIALGTFTSRAPLVRIHSECLTGDVFGSAKCDCGEQLKEAMEKIRAEGGVLIYLRQEGRGIGLYNKLDAYALQSQGLDTYEANRTLGFDDDLRKYDVAAQILKAMGIKKIRLLSNNPDKRNQLENSGIKIEELVSTGVFVSDKNRGYLEAKVKTTSHNIDLSAPC